MNAENQAKHYILFVISYLIILVRATERFEVLEAMDSCTRIIYVAGIDDEDICENPRSSKFCLMV